uniref:Zinc finger C2HC domain-containing protein 1A n=1 Tax=Panagrellus redivivus TaxID=6233 RepID=A0A7E4ZSQ0_PANRE
MEEADEKTYPCKICGRKFIKSSLVIHESACKKLTKLARKPFDSGKQRASGSDIPLNAVRKAQKEKEKHGGTFPRPKTHWRQRHEEFIGAVAGAKHVEIALKTGAPLPPPPKSSYNPDYVQCDYCGRRFNSNAAERHIPFCREQQARTAGRAPPSRAPRTGAKPPTRSQSQPRTPQQPRSPSTSNRRPSTKAYSPGNATASGNRTPSTKSGNRPVANSAGINGSRTTHLPTPVKRSNSAPRTAHAPKTPGTAYSTSSQSRNAPPTTSSRKSIPTSSGTYKPPSTAKSTASASSGRRTSSTRRRDY